MSIDLTGQGPDHRRTKRLIGGSVLFSWGAGFLRIGSCWLCSLVADEQLIARMDGPPWIKVVADDEGREWDIEIFRNRREIVPSLYHVDLPPFFRQVGLFEFLEACVKAL